MLAEPRGEPYVVRGRMCRAAQGGRGRAPRVPLEGERRQKAGVGLVLQNPLEGSWTRRPFGNATYRANYTLKTFTHCCYWYYCDMGQEVGAGAGPG